MIVGVLFRAIANIFFFHKELLSPIGNIHLFLESHLAAEARAVLTTIGLSLPRAH